MVILSKHAKRACQIGDDSWRLINFEDLPVGASKKRQVEALRADQRWIQNHCDYICREIDQLIFDINEEAENED